MKNLLLFAAIGLLSTLVGFTIVVASFASGWPVSAVLRTASQLSFTLGLPALLINTLALSVLQKLGKL